MESRPKLLLLADGALSPMLRPTRRQRDTEIQWNPNILTRIVDIINAAVMDETYCTYVDDERFDIHDYDNNTDHDTDDDADDDTDDDIDDDTNDGGRGNMYPIKAQGSRIKDLVRP